MKLVKGRVLSRALIQSLTMVSLLAAALGYAASAYGQDTDDATPQETKAPVSLIAGTGTKGYVPLWYSSTTLGDSNLFVSPSGTNKGFLGIGTTDPVAAFEVNEAIPTSYNYLAYFNNITKDVNTIVTIQSPEGGTNVGVDQTGGSYVYSSNARFYIGPDQTNTLWVGDFGCGNTCNGKVGMQTSTPQNPLDVAGAVAIGSYGGVDVAPTNGLIVSGSVGIGTPTPTNLLTLVQGGGPAIADGWNTYSSARWKTNIQPLTGALGKVEQLRGVSYDLKGSGKHEIGVIAEEVAKVVPEVVAYEKNGKDVAGVDYSRLTALLIEAVKQQQAQIARQAEQIKEQRALVSEQQRLTNAQHREIAKLNRKVGTLEVSLRTVEGLKSPLVLASQIEQ
jgi:Chaperone of endosialidase